MKYSLNFIRKKKYPTGVLLTTDYGTWAYLDNDQYKKLMNKDLSQDLYTELEEKGVIVTEKNKPELSQKYRDYQWPVHSGASLHIFVPTLKCNHTCIYCYALRLPPDCKEGHMSMETAKKAVEFMFESPNNCYSVEFTGGEPLLNWPVIKFVVEYTEELNKKHNKSILYSIVTNGTQLTEEIIEFARKYEIGLCISLDGPKELHDRHRRYYSGKPTYDDVVFWINKLKKDPDHARWLNALPVITKFSIKYWKEMIDEYVKFGFKSLRLKYMACFGFAREIWEQIAYTPDEYIHLWKNAINYMIELNRKGIVIRDGMATLFLTKIFKGINPGFSELSCPCGATIGQILYNWDGDVYPCDEARVFPEFKLGNVHTDTYSKVASHPTTCSMINVSSNLSFGCDRCPYFSFCGLCPVHSFSMQGTLVTKLPYDIKCIMHKQMFDYLFEKILFNKEDAEILKKWVDMGGPA